jgi:hypothetical protein
VLTEDQVSARVAEHATAEAALSAAEAARHDAHERLTAARRALSGANSTHRLTRAAVLEARTRVLRLTADAAPLVSIESAKADLALADGEHEAALRIMLRAKHAAADLEKETRQAQWIEASAEAALGLAWSRLPAAQQHAIDPTEPAPEVLAGPALPPAHPGPRKRAMADGAKHYFSTCPKPGHTVTVRTVAGKSCFLCEAARRPGQFAKKAAKVPANPKRLTRAQQAERKGAFRVLEGAARAWLEDRGGAADGVLKAALEGFEAVSKRQHADRGCSTTRKREPLEVSAVLAVAAPLDLRTGQHEAVRSLKRALA